MPKKSTRRSARVTLCKKSFFYKTTSPQEVTSRPEKVWQWSDVLKSRTELMFAQSSLKYLSGFTLLSTSPLKTEVITFRSKYSETLIFDTFWLLSLCDCLTRAFLLEPSYDYWGPRQNQNLGPQQINFILAFAPLTYCSLGNWISFCLKHWWHSLFSF